MKPFSFYITILLLASSSAHSDTYEKVICVLEEDVKSCSHFDEKNDRVNISLHIDDKRVPKFDLVLHQQSSFSSSARDWASLFIAFIALCAFLLNVRTFKEQGKNREKDKRLEDFNFWLKEVAFPNYFKEIIQSLKETKRIIVSNQDLNEKFDNWITEKDKIKDQILHGKTLPYFQDVFVSLKRKIYELEDILAVALVPDDEIFESPSESEHGDAATQISEKIKTLDPQTIEKAEKTIGAIIERL